MGRPPANPITGGGGRKIGRAISPVVCILEGAARLILNELVVLGLMLLRFGRRKAGSRERANAARQSTHKQSRPRMRRSWRAIAKGAGRRSAMKSIAVFALQVMLAVL